MPKGDYVGASYSMFYYVLLFKYAGKWHMDCFERETRYNREKAPDRRWLEEAVNLSVEKHRLSVEASKAIAEANLFPLTLKVKDGDNAEVILSSCAIDAISDIPIRNKLAGRACSPSAE